MRWVQETDQCISIVVDSMTFVLDNPQNVRVLSEQIAQVLRFNCFKVLINQVLSTRVAVTEGEIFSLVVYHHRSQ